MIDFFGKLIIIIISKKKNNHDEQKYLELNISLRKF